MTFGAALPPPASRRAGVILSALVPAAMPFIAAPVAARLAGSLSGAGVPPGPSLAAALGALLATALCAAAVREGAVARLCRQILGSLAVGAQPALLVLAPEGQAHLAVALAALAGSLAGPDLADAIRIARATAAAGEEFLLPRGRSTWIGVALFVATLLLAAATPPYIGGHRALALAGLLVLPWVAWRAAVTGGASRAVRVGGAAVAALATGAGLVASAGGALALPMPRRVLPQVTIEPVAELAPRTWLWVRPVGERAVVRIHTAEDLLLYEADDERRLAEAAVHLAAPLLPRIRRALVIANESGAIAREILKYPECERVVHVSLIPGLARAFLEHPLLWNAHGGALADSRVVRLELERVQDLPRALLAHGRFDLVVAAPAAPLQAVRWLLGPPGRSFFADHLAPGGFLVRRLLTLADPSFAWCFVQESADAGWYGAGYRLPFASSTLDEILVELSSPTPFDANAIRGLRVPTAYLTEAHLDKLFAFGRDQDYRPQARRGACADEIGITP
jgi:predicted membrane-bound spermidine synthase